MFTLEQKKNIQKSCWETDSNKELYTGIDQLTQYIIYVKSLLYNKVRILKQR